MIKNIKGFTLVELLVATSVFSVLIVVASSLFVNAMRLQKETIDAQALQNEARYILQKISQEWRGRELDYYTSQISADNEAQQLVFNSDQYGRVLSIYLDQSDIVYRIDTHSGYLSDYLNSDTVSVTDLKFLVHPRLDPRLNPSDNVQPRLTVLLGMQLKNPVSKKIQSLKTQTTVSAKIYSY